VSGRRRLVVIAAVGVLALVVAGVLAFPEIVRRTVVWRLAVTTGREVTLAGVELDVFRGRLALRDLRVIDRDRAPLATVARLDARFSPRDLLRGHLRVTDATLEAPAVRIVRTGPGEFNVSDLLERKAGGGGALAVTLERFALRGGTVVLEDRTLSPPHDWRIEAVTMDARSVSSVPEAPPGVVTLQTVAAGSPVSVWVTGVRLSPLRFHATVIARDVAASLAALYLPPGSPFSPAEGKLDATVTIEQEPAAGTRIGLDAAFGGILLRRPGQDVSFLYAPAVRLTVEELRLRGGAVAVARVALDGGSIVLEDTRLAPVRRWQADGIALEAKNLSSARDAPPGVGTLRAVVAGSPLSVWATNIRVDPLELHATAIVRGVDFSLFRLYVPPDLPVQPERGVVNATIRVDHDTARGTRLALDARLGNVELRRPAHFVTAPALRVTAEDIALAGGVVTVGHVAVASDRLALEDRTLRPPRTWPVRDLAVEASRLSSRREDVQGLATARATVAGAAVSAFLTHVRLDPLQLRGTAILRNLDLALVQLYLPAAVPVQLDRGIVNASVEVNHDLAAGTRLTGDVTLTGADLRGRDAAAGLSIAARTLRVMFADVRRHEDTLGVGRLELTASGSLADSRAAVTRVDLERFRLATEEVAWPVRGPARVELGARFRDGGEIDASGTALLTAPPPAIAWTSDMAVQLKAVDVSPAAAYVPAASGLGGRVSGKVTATVAHGPSLTARVRGDVSGSRFALAEGGRTLIALAGFEATGLDVAWPERVAMARLRLRRPHALVERDRQGAFPLLLRFARPPAGPSPAAAPATAGGAPGAAPPAPDAGPEGQRGTMPAIAVDEVVVERGGVTLVDARDGTPARVEVRRIDLTLRDARWPSTAPARLRLDAALPEGGTLNVEGTVGAEPASVELKLALADAGLAALQPFVPFRAGVRGRLDATLSVTGPLSPAPRLVARGDATLRSMAISDGPRQVLTVDRLGVRGIDVRWPDRVDLDTVRVRRSWALVERDHEGRFLLRTLLERAPGAAAPGPPAPPGPAPAATPLEFHLRQGIFEEGAATIVDAVTTPPARFEVAGARLTVQDLTWPQRGPARLQLTSPMPSGGRLDAGGTLLLEPFRLEGRAMLDGVELAPGQPYLPIEGRVAGRVTGDLGVKIALDPLVVQVAGQARLQRFRLSDGDRPLVTAGRLEAVGVDIDWPRRVAVQRVQLRYPSLLIERDAKGEIVLPRLVTPRWNAPAATGPSPAQPATAAPPSRSAPPVIEIGTVSLERGSGRFVDQTLTPPYAEQLSRVDVTITGLTTARGQRARFTGGGELGGGGTFKLQGEAVAGDPQSLDLKLDIDEFPLPRANPYLDRFTTWTATRGTLSAAAHYTLLGTKIEATHDVVVRRLEVARSGSTDEVEQRLGLPLGMLVSLLKNARGEIRLAVPVSGDLATREFDFQEAVWSAVRNVAIRLLALPFSRVGSMFFTEDSKVEAVTFAPAVFEAGTPRLAAAMPEHLARIAAFLRDAPSVNVRLAPILTQADLDALKRERVLGRLGGLPGSAGGAGDALAAAQREYRERWPDRAVPATLEAIVGELATADPPPEEAMRGLGTRRLDVVRQELAARGIDAARLAGSARRVPLVEAGGPARVEFDLRP
jgi:hypothetical protein